MPSWPTSPSERRRPSYHPWAVAPGPGSPPFPLRSESACYPSGFPAAGNAGSSCPIAAPCWFSEPWHEPVGRMGRFVQDGRALFKHTHKGSTAWMRLGVHRGSTAIRLGCSVCRQCCGNRDTLRQMPFWFLPILTNAYKLHWIPNYNIFGHIITFWKVLKPNNKDNTINSDWIDVVCLNLTLSLLLSRKVSFQVKIVSAAPQFPNMKL